MEKPVDSKSKFHIEILSVLKEAQQQHGLRHKDYQSYHQYISRKLHRMRKSLNFQQGKGNRITPKKITKTLLTDSRYVLIKLFEAERAWAHAMQLKNESNSEPRKVYHMRSRLKRAVDRASELWELCRWAKCDEHEHVECELCAKCDAHTYVESQAYYYNMQAIRFFEISEWKKAKSMYDKAYGEYSGLAKAVDKDQEQIYLTKCDELRPLIRYCANNDGDLQEMSDIAPLHAAGGNMDQFNDLMKQIYKNQVAIMTEVNWLGIVIPVKQENVRLTILALNDANKELCKSELNNNAKIAIYDSLLKTCTESLNSVRDDLKSVMPNNNPAQITNLNLDTMNRLQILFVYLHYVKLTKTVERNLLIIENNMDTSASKPQNMARLYDTVMQNLQEMAGLSGLNSESNDNNAQQEIQAKISAYTAYRCYYLSQAHLLMKRFAECTALLTRTLRHCENALSNLKLIGNSKSEQSGVSVTKRLIPGPSVVEMVEKINALIESISADQLICRADRCLSMIDDASIENSPASENIELPLAKRLDEFVEDSYLSKKTSSQSTGRLIQTCPDFEPIPVKPVFFDLAFYHVKFPSLEDRIKDRKSRGADSKGLTGMVKGWIWGSK